MADEHPAIDDAALRAVIDCIIPADTDPGALDLGTDGFVRARLAEDVAGRAAVAAGLAALEAAAAARNASFAALGPEERTVLLVANEDEPWFRLLVTLTSLGFYADPLNGGNTGAASWAMIGYDPRLPEGPSGPPRSSR